MRKFRLAESVRGLLDLLAGTAFLDRRDDDTVAS
jgi:hypothetical protein